jgi:hypothetical protein
MRVLRKKAVLFLHKKLQTEKGGSHLHLQRLLGKHPEENEVQELRKREILTLKPMRKN